MHYVSAMFIHDEYCIIYMVIRNFILYDLFFYVYVLEISLKNICICVFTIFLSHELFFCF